MVSGSEEDALPWEGTQVARKALLLTLAHYHKVIAKFAFDQDVVKIGRDPNNDVQLPSRSVSRVHCRIERSGSQFLLSDNGSKNGILLNGKPTNWAEIDEGDMIGIEGFRLWVSLVYTKEGSPLPKLSDPGGPTIPSRAISDQ